MKIEASDNKKTSHSRRCVFIMQLVASYSYIFVHVSHSLCEKLSQEAKALCRRREDKVNMCI